MFEPIHGSAFDIMGKASPIPWHVLDRRDDAGAPGETDAAARLMQAVEHVTQIRAAHARPGRHSYDGRRDQRGLR